MTGFILGVVLGTIAQAGTGTQAVDTIVNTGHKAWSIIKDNEPTINIDSSYASALPVRKDGEAYHWSELTGWHDSGSKRLKFVINDQPFAMKPSRQRIEAVLDFRYRYGGGVDGKGKYLEAVWVEPNARVAWGWHLDISTKIIGPINVAPAGHEPIAALDLVVSTRAYTVFSQILQSFRVRIFGNGKIFRSETQEL